MAVIPRDVFASFLVCAEDGAELLFPGSQCKVQKKEKVFYMLLNTGTADTVTAWVCLQTTHPAE